MAFAIALFKRGLLVNPKCARAHLGIAKAEFALNEGEKALQEIGKAVALNPNMLEAYLLQASIYSQQQRHDKAISSLTQAIKLDPTLASSYYLRARAAYFATWFDDDDEAPDMIADLENPDRVLIGGEDKEAINELVNIYSRWIDKVKVLTTDLWSSELSKLISNAFLAQRISSINTISALCEATGARIKDVSLAVGMDRRIGKYFLNSGPGFGGSCFKKDISNLVYISNHYGLFEVADYWQKVLDINSWQQKRFVELIVKKMFGTISSKKIAILGFAFKANTNDTRESPAIFVVNQLLNEGANLIIHDPKVTKDQIESDLSSFQRKNKNEKIGSPNLENRGTWSFSSDLTNVFENAHAVIILTEWSDYSYLDWKRISKQILNTAWIFDTRNILNKVNFENLNTNVWKIGNG